MPPTADWLTDACETLDGPLTGGVEDAAARATSYRIVGHSLEVHGYCPLCAAGSSIENDSHMEKEA